MTPIQGRSFAGLVMAHLALTVVVCGGLVLLLPASALSQGLPATLSAIPITDCDASANPAGDHQLTKDDGELSAPDSDNDDDDDTPTGSDAALAVDQCRMITRGDVTYPVHVDVERWRSRSVDGHSLRGPPADDEKSSDADLDDDDDDDPSAEYSDLLPPSTGGEICLLTPVEFVSISTTRSSDLSLRAPPL